MNVKNNAKKLHEKMLSFVLHDLIVAQIDQFFN